MVAPAGAVSRQELEKGIARLKYLGFGVRLGKGVFDSLHGLAGSDEIRAQDLLAMFEDPEVAAILCARGGYGASRIIPLLDPEKIRRHPKIFVGSSDITVLLLYLVQNCGLTVFHGPMVAPHFGRVQSSVTEAYFMKAVAQPEALGLINLQGMKVIKPGEAQGELIGGCLSMLCSAIGTPYAPQTRGRVLFLEDVNEPSYRIDRMLTHMKSAGLMAGVRGVVFGQMQGCLPKPDEGFGLEEVIADVLKDFEGPVVFGLPSGHGPDCITIPLGIPVSVEAPGIRSLKSQGVRIALHDSGVSNHPRG